MSSTSVQFPVRLSKDHFEHRVKLRERKREKESLRLTQLHTDNSHLQVDRHSQILEKNRKEVNVEGGVQ